MESRSVQREYWRHKPTGALWAVELRDTAIVAVCGPMDARNGHPDLLDYLPYDIRDVVWVRRNRDDFVREGRPLR